MRRFLILFFAASLSALCQFSNLTTTDDGRQVYFSSVLQLRGTTNENTNAKIFMHDASGLHLAAQQDNSDLTAPLVSGNGAVTGYIGTSSTTIQFAGTFYLTTLPYQCQMSGNARYALCQTPRFLSVFVIDLFSGAMSAPQSSSCLGRHEIASNGMAVGMGSPGNVVLFGVNSSALEISINDNGCPIISDDGSVIVVGGTVYDVATGAQKRLGDSWYAYFPPTSISNDGSAFLVRAADRSGIYQVALAHSNGGALEPLTNDTLGFQEAAISGDGSTVYASSKDGRLVQIDVASKTITTLIGSTPLVTGKYSGVPGSLIVVSGEALSSSMEAASSFPAPGKIGDVQVLINGTPAPLISIAPGAIQLQIPWETPVGAATIEVVRPPTLFLQPPTLINIQAINPVQASGPISQDFSKLLGIINPIFIDVNAANPGDIVSYYFTGLGPVNATVADGAFAPINPLALVTAQLRVTGDYPVAGEELPITYAGLAPGTVGVYLLSIQLPVHVPRPNSPISYFTQFAFVTPTLWFSATQSIQLDSVPVNPN